MVPECLAACQVNGNLYRRARRVTFAVILDAVGRGPWNGRGAACPAFEKCDCLWNVVLECSRMSRNMTGTLFDCGLARRVYPFCYIKFAVIPDNVGRTVGGWADRRGDYLERPSEV